eukprot:162369_1
MSTLCLVVLCLTNLITTSVATNHTSEESYATLQPDIRDILLQYLPSAYDLPQNIYEWNVTEIVRFINAKDPELLYTIDTSLLFTLFPIYFIQNLPRDILIAHKLYSYLSIEDPLYCFNITNCTDNPTISQIDPCYGPFVHTKYDGVFVFPNGSDSYQCALRCENTQILYGIDDEEMSLIDNFNWIFCSLFLALCIVIWINICMDIKFSKHKCIQRPFLFHAPICIVLMYTIVAICFLLPLIIGKDSITCAHDVNNVKTFGSYNPGASYGCTIAGIIFYFAELSVGLYTLFFSIALWKQFNSALRSMLKDLIAVCRCRNNCEKINLCICTCTAADNTVHVSENRKSVPLLFSKTMLTHFGIYSFVIICIIIGCFDKAIGSIPPLGICALGTLGNDNTKYIIYQIIPLSIISILSTLFLPAAIVLLIRITKQSKSTNIKSQFSKLQSRLLVYFIFVQIAWFGVVFLILIFHLERPKFEQAAQERTKCMLLKSGSGTISNEIFMDECMHGYEYWVGFYVIMGLVLPLAALGSLVLSCGASNKSRWGIISRHCLFRNATTDDEKMLGQLQEAVSNSHDVTKTEKQPQSTESGPSIAQIPRKNETNMNNISVDIQLSESQKSDNGK